MQGLLECSEKLKKISRRVKINNFKIFSYENASFWGARDMTQ